MDTDRLWQVLQVAVFVVLVAAVLVLSGLVPLPLPAPDEYERTTVTVYENETGTRLGRVEARIADTYSKKYTGLSDTDSLGPNEGMVFIYEKEAMRTFVMRKMAFPIDMVFVGANGTIMTIHHAEVPPKGTSESQLTSYRGRAKWVLEVNFNWTVEHGVEEGDRIVVGEHTES